MLLMMCLVFSGPQVAQAGTWAIASIDQVGQNFSNGIVMLTHVDASPTFTKKWFRLNPDAKNQLLAVCLTAESLGYKLTIEIAADNYTLTSIYMNKK